MNTGQKVTRTIQSFPTPVQSYVFGLMEGCRTRNVRLYHESPGWELYLAEGCQYKMFLNGESGKTLRMQSQMSLHAGGSAASHKIGSRIPIPPTAWVVEFELFCGKPFIGVHHVGLEQIGE